MLQVCCAILGPKTYHLFNKAESLSPLGVLLCQYSEALLEIEKEKSFAVSALLQGVEHVVYTIRKRHAPVATDSPEKLSEYHKS